MHQKQLIVITGPESSGKSTLCRDLSHSMPADVVPEYARFYLETLQRSYEFRDLLSISRGQELSMLEKRDGKTGGKLVLLDTWALVLMIWSEHKYNKSHKCFLDLLHRYPIQHFFLCTPEMPWEKDPLRESPRERDVLFEKYLNKINSFGLEHTVLEGDRQYRLEQATQVIESILSS